MGEMKGNELETIVAREKSPEASRREAVETHK